MIMEIDEAELEARDEEESRIYKMALNTTRQIPEYRQWYALRIIELENELDSFEERNGSYGFPLLGWNDSVFKTLGQFSWNWGEQDDNKILAALEAIKDDN